MIIGLILILLLVSNNQTVTAGAREGLMLWYNSILPLLLPFILISGYIVDSTYKKNKATDSKNNQLQSILLSIALGVFCGYPIGAKCTADFIRTNRLKSSLGNIILPLSNNLSPMFISGYVCTTILHNSISFLNTLYLIYLPYIIYTVLTFLFIYFKPSKISNKNALISTDNLSAPSGHQQNKTNETENRILTAITQITSIGVYIMICSIIIKLIINTAYIPDSYKPMLSAATEVSSGINYVAQKSGLLSEQKTALILAATSFGGLSSILQTSCVIKNSGLSIVRYSTIKLICSIATYYMTQLFI